MAVRNPIALWRPIVATVGGPRCGGHGCLAFLCELTTLLQAKLSRNAMQRGEFQSELRHDFVILRMLVMIDEPSFLLLSKNDFVSHF